MKSLTVLLATLCVFLQTSLLWSEPLLAGSPGEKSGIRVKRGDILDEAGFGGPPAYETTTRRYSFEIRNVAATCDEEVKISNLLFANHPTRGKATFLGYVRNPDDGPPDYVDEWTFELKDGTSRTVYFDVATGEDAQGCDFHSFRIMPRICDVGRKCFFCCDWFDRGCEAPTAFTLTGLGEVLLDPTSLPPADDGVVEGTVRVTDGLGPRFLVAVITAVKKTACLPDGPDGSVGALEIEVVAGRLPDQEGEYRFEDLPYGIYTITSRVPGIGELTTENVVVASSVPVVINFDY